ncbi:MAG: type II toxin-antitoxin system HicB family antitoxin [Bdellovibrionales bacterium]|nr:type II toxin-antitoxin system HicB family antitoxin [Bdellovibrionales bacterium]NQZ17643.1 type II toxin-antitoxin system HicB family antitoxin [Bdellovibrionales bacterium]
MIKYQAKIKKDGKAYSVEFPDLPGCFSMGDTLEEAKQMASEALSLYLEEARDPKWQLPKAKSRKSSQYYWIKPDLSVGIPLLLRQKRLEAGFSQSQLARKLGITTQQLQKLETPGKSNPTVKTLNKISEVLNADLEIDLVA